MTNFTTQNSPSKYLSMVSFPPQAVDYLHPTRRGAGLPGGHAVPVGAVGESGLGKPNNYDFSRLIPPLKIKSTRNRSEKTQLNHDLLYALKELLPNEKRLQACYEAVVDTAKPYVTIDYAANVNKVRTKDVCRCGYIWCPNCGSLEAEKEARRLKVYFTAWGLGGWATVSGVFTLQHDKDEKLNDVDKRLDKGLAKLLDSPAGRRFKQKWSIVTFQRSPDLTYSFNGWHPHRNYTFYLKRRLLSPKELEEFEIELKNLWMNYCQQAGGYADFKHGFKVLPGDAFSISDYIASKANGCGLESQAHEHAARGKFSDGWGQAEEMVAIQKKQARGVDSLTPAGLLLAYLWGDDVELFSADKKQSRILTKYNLGELVREYVQNYKGKRLVYTLPGGIRDHIGPLCEQFKDEIEQILQAKKVEELPEYKPFVDVRIKVWFYLVSKRLQHVLFFEIADNEGDVAKVREAYQEWGINAGDVWFHGCGPAPAWWFGDGVTDDQVKGILELDQDMRDWNAQPVKWPV